MKKSVMTIAAALLVSAAPAYVAFQAHADEHEEAVMDHAAEAADEAPVEAVEEVVAEEHTLADGTKILVKADEVFVVGEDGVETPAPDGEHTLEDGTVVKTMEGKIVTDEAAPAEEEAPAEESAE
ncbi:MAG: hypothetical protein KDI13_10515 [Alphaproteobacteria bacterium]|nr:hypothetical protein [Alphaproteobacteria bacterium]